MNLKILFRKSENGLLINISSDPITIHDTEALDNVIKYLDIQYRLTNEALDAPEFQRCISELKKVQYSLSRYLFKNIFFDYLLSSHCLDCPIIPVIELNNSLEEPSFIFTIKKNNEFYLIWENKNDGRATNIYKVNVIKDYSQAIQNLFDLIKASLKNKRSGISNYSSQLPEINSSIKYMGKIAHSDLNGWIKNLESKLHN